MNRPFIFSHMITSIDGKIDGRHKEISERGLIALDFYRIAFGENSYYQTDAWLSGRATSEAAFTKGKLPKIDAQAQAASVPEGDYIAETNLSKYYISVDPSGKLGWDKNYLQYRDTTAHIVEVLTERASNEYKAFLRNLDISYIIAGKNDLDYAYLMEKLEKHFPIETLMLGGGAVLNWSFLQAGLCDEVSILMAPFADGSASSHTIFQAKEGLSEDDPVKFNLAGVERRDNDAVWLRYIVVK